MIEEDTKECIKCHRILPLSEFPQNGTTGNICKDCKREYKRGWRQVKGHRRKEKLKSYVNMQNFINSLKTPCVICGEATLCCIDFHHLDPLTKKFSIGLMRNKAKTTIAEEATKCICLCSNCHRKVHAGLINLKNYINA